MTYKLTTHPKPTFLHAVVTGRNTKENVEKYLEEVLRECLTQAFSKVLIEERLEGPRLRIMDVFVLASEGSYMAQGKLKAVAYVDVNAEGNLMKFAGDVANNRGLNVGIFQNVIEAENWLLGQGEA